MGVLTYQPLVAMVSAFLLAVILVPILSAPAKRMGLVDEPGGRKRHLGDIPLTGGLAIFSSFAFGLFLIDVNLQPYASLVLGMGLMLATGIIDDLIEISAGAKLLAQIAAAILMVREAGGEVIETNREPASVWDSNIIACSDVNRQAPMIEILQ